MEDINEGMKDEDQIFIDNLIKNNLNNDDENVNSYSNYSESNEKEDK